MRHVSQQKTSERGGQAPAAHPEDADLETAVYDGALAHTGDLDPSYIS